MTLPANSDDRHKAWLMALHSISNKTFTSDMWHPSSICNNTSCQWPDCVRREADRSAILAIRTGAFSVDMPHSTELCPGNCKIHFLHTADTDLFNRCDWGYLNDLYFEEEYSIETAEQTARRLALEAAREENERLSQEVIRQNLYAQELAFRQSLGQKKAVRGTPAPERKLIDAPCKWLYAVPGKDGVFGYSPCAECWGHEYTDAKGKYNEPHKCLYIHTNQPEWKPEWNTLAVRRDAWRGPKPAAAPKQENRFGALASESKPAGRPLQRNRSYA